jgi:predicted TIM-barrel fold metal-dependent hydrolase
MRRRPSEVIRSEQIVLSCESEETGLDRVLDASGPATVLYASDYCHWDCHFPYSVRDIISGDDLSFAQKELVLYKNAVEFFDLKDLPEPKAMAAAMGSWGNGNEGVPPT